MRRITSLIIAFFTVSICAGILALPGSASAATIIYDNLSIGDDANWYPTGGGMLGQMFKTDDVSYVTTSTTLRLKEKSFGSFAVSLWSNHPMVPEKDSYPEAQITEFFSGTTTEAGLVNTEYRNIFFNFSSALAANTSYWIVVRSVTVETPFWAYDILDNTPGGVGTQPKNNAEWAGDPWQPLDYSPYHMQVEANAVPEPSAFALFLLALPAIGFLLRRMNNNR